MTVCARLALVTLVGLIASPASAEDTTQTWVNLIATAPLADGISIQGDAIARSQDGWDGVRQSILRATLLVEVAPGLKLGGGYSEFFNTPAGRPHTNDSVPFAQANWAIGNVGPGRLSSRTRLEFRMRGGDPDTSYRLRQQVAYTIPLGENLPAIGLSEEAFFELRDTAGGIRSGYSQSFAAVSLGFPLASGLTVAPGYLAQIQRVRGGPDRTAHVANLTITAAF